MNVISIVLICCVVFFAGIGGLIGAFKGFTKVKSWGVEYLLVVLIGVPVAGLVTKKMQGSPLAGGFISLGIIIFLIVLFMAGFIVARKLLVKYFEKRKQYNYYKNYIQNEQTTAQILGAISVEDKKEYKSLLKMKKKQERGGVWNILNRVFGGVTLAIKAAVIVSLIIICILVALDFTRLCSEGGKLYSAFGKIYENGGWKFIKKHALDFIAVALLMLSVRSGYESGIVSSLWTFVLIGMIAGAGVLAWYFAFKVDDFIAAAEKLSQNTDGFFGKIASALSIVKMTPQKAAQLLIAILMFLLMLGAVIIIAVFAPKIIDKARDSKIFCIADGVLGAIAMTLLILAFVLVLGAVANSMHEAQFMGVFNAYFEKSSVATYFYDKNLLNSMGILNDLPFKNYFA